MERYDVAIIGTGPAGLEAAITAKVRNKKILLIGSADLSAKVEKAHTIKNYLGLPEISGVSMQEQFKKHLDELDIGITQDRVNTVYAMGNYFAIQGHADMYEASSVILACGMAVAKPFEGEMDYLGRGVSYCATCDGALYKGKSAVVIGYSKEDEKEASFLAEIAREVIYLPMYEEVVSLPDTVIIIRDAKIKNIEKGDMRMILNLENDRIEADGIFILRENVAPSQLVPGLEIENNQVVVKRNLSTNIAGLFACGDIAGPPYQYIKAAGEGNVAALSAVSYLSDMK